MPEYFRPTVQDAFNPTLTDSKSLTVSIEQLNYIKRILDTACSDSDFVNRAFVGINLVLTKGSVKSPSITSLSPSNAVIGAPSFTLHVKGTNLLPGSVIVFAGYEEPTTHVSNSEITTLVDMSVWLGADTIPVMVLSPDGITSNSMMFEFTAAAKGIVAKDIVTKDKVSNPLHK